MTKKQFNSIYPNHKPVSLLTRGAETVLLQDRRDGDSGCRQAAKAARAAQAPYRVCVEGGILVPKHVVSRVSRLLVLA